MKVTKRFTFEASHKLLYHQGKCRKLHGHSYKVEVTFEGPVHDPLSRAPDAGMVMDFGDIGTYWEKYLEHLLDHDDLNSALCMTSPTAEMIAAWITAMFQRDQFPIIETKVQETESGWATCEPADPMVALLVKRNLLPPLEDSV